MWHCITVLPVPAISKEHTAFKASATDYAVTQCHIAEKWTLQPHHHENLNACKGSIDHT
jgi:hypothetical protein